MRMKNVKKKVKKQLDRSNPRQMAFWFMQRSLILMKEAKVPYEEVIKTVDEAYERKDS